MTEQSPFTMTIDMGALEALGIKLYSNAAAVLTELVANAYDADATLVQIEWNIEQYSVIVSDNGSGMTQQELNDRFLVTGYQKRLVEGSHSMKWNRKFMGRKGIGKLSVFSIADEIFVYTRKVDETTGCRIDVDDLKQRIASRQDYHPDKVDVPEEHNGKGTTIVLNRLSRKRVSLTASALRKRLARRFDVLDQTPPEQGGFRIEIDGEHLTFEDRQDLKRLEFLWEFGEQRLPDQILPKETKRYVLDECKVADRDDWKVRGWIGTARTPSDLADDGEGGSLKNIMVLARKRPIHEGIIDKLDFSRVFGSYVTGQIEADFLDLDDEDDIATSDRQRLIEDDPRVQGLSLFLRKAFKTASDQWNAERPKHKSKDAFEEFPKLEEWRDSLPGWQQEPATKMISTIAALTFDQSNEKTHRASLYRSGVLAFARIGLRKKSDELDQLSTLDAEHLLKLFGAQEEYEASLWADILRGRVEAIQKLERLSDDNAVERVVQEHVFDHLWLLDASWERATADPHMEQSLHKIAPGVFPKDKTGKNTSGRIDIRYREAVGTHIIVELKRYDRSCNIDELITQGSKYYDAMSSVLEQENRAGERIEVVFVLGKIPIVKNRHSFSDDNDLIASRLKEINGRYKLYRQLVTNALKQYDDYLNASQQAHELERLLTSLETE
ncbi:MAG: ATP-binding protein [Acidimicrobiaceae bacterium]|nr:ATP-binding protein [Acidimicrobiaceae bacterium]